MPDTSGRARFRPKPLRGPSDAERLYREDDAAQIRCWGQERFLAAFNFAASFRPGSRRVTPRQGLQSMGSAGRHNEGLTGTSRPASSSGAAGGGGGGGGSGGGGGGSGGGSGGGVSSG